MDPTYDPLVQPDPQEWLEADEMERLDAVLEYHEKATADLADERLHALVHLIVENQAALGDETPAGSTIERLMEQGLGRHDAVHAVGSVLAGHIWQLMRSEGGEEDEPDAAYFDELGELTARKWLEEYGETEA